MTPLETLKHHVTGAIERGEGVAIVGIPAKVETFKCATGSGWGILANGLMDCDIPYSATEQGAVKAGKAAGYANILTTRDAKHYSNT